MTEKNTIALAKAIKAQLAEGIRKQMKRKGFSQSELARRMSTSRAVVHRLLKEGDTSLTLSTLAKLSVSLGVKIVLRLVPAK